jgi:hypothetical protein
MLNLSVTHCISAPAFVPLAGKPATGNRVAKVGKTLWHLGCMIFFDKNVCKVLNKSEFAP